MPRDPSVRGLLPLIVAGAAGARVRGTSLRSTRRARAAALGVLALFDGGAGAAAAAPPSCAAPGVGWCVARRFPGTVPGGELGFRFGEPLDVDGDGNADLAAGARFTKEGTSQSGAAGVWSGATGRPIRIWKGPFANGLFGHAMLPVSDVSGDGLADVLVAAPNAPLDGVMHGVVTMRSPQTGAELWRRIGAAGAQYGWDLALAGDQNGDGRMDVFVGAPGGAGRVELVSGKDGAVLRTYAPSLPTASFGWYVARVDDLDGDGRADLAAAAPPGYAAEDPPNGAAYVFAAASGRELRRFGGNAAGAGFGEQVAALADLDGDGRGEIVVSAPGSNDQSRSLVGEVMVYSGATGAEIRRWRSREAGELYGRMIVGAGDVDGDGADDLAIGAPWHRVGADDRVGRVELRSGRSGAVVAELVGERAESWFGWHVRRAPDPENRARPALLIGSLRQSVGGAPGVGVVDLWVLRRTDPGPTESGGAAAGGATSGRR